MTRRLHIEQLSLDLRGIDPALARAALPLLGAALATRLGGTSAPAAATTTTAAATGDRGPQALARHLAEQVAARLPANPQPEPDHAARRID